MIIEKTNVVPSGERGSLGVWAHGRSMWYVRYILYRSALTGRRVVRPRGWGVGGVPPRPAGERGKGGL